MTFFRVDPPVAFSRSSVDRSFTDYGCIDQVDPGPCGGKAVCPATVEQAQQDFTMGIVRRCFPGKNRKLCAVRQQLQHGSVRNFQRQVAFEEQRSGYVFSRRDQNDRLPHRRGYG